MDASHHFERRVADCKLEDKKRKRTEPRQDPTLDDGAGERDCSTAGDAEPRSTWTFRKGGAVDVAYVEDNAFDGRQESKEEDDRDEQR